MEATLLELLDLLVRWIHVIAGIMWIGNSLLFNWLDRNLRPLDPPRERVDGTIWLLHSGGFYEIEKKLLAPGQMPEKLHWFMWQNLSTWMSGMALLVLVYYLNGAAMLLDPAVSSLGDGAAIGVGLAALAGSWLIYDLLWRSPLGRRGRLTAALSFSLLVALCYGLSRLLSGRAAYIHVGAVLGTLMTGNVWLYILPSQRALVAATRAGQPQDPALARRAKQRSIHNNYMTFPVIFLMISNHFPSTYASPQGWLILAILMLGGASVRHAMNIRFHYRGWLRWAAGATLIALSLVWLLIVRGRAPEQAAPGQRVAFAQVREIITYRCTICHSARPTDDQFRAPPLGIAFDSPQQIGQHAGRIRERAVVLKTMPLANKTGMTAAERELLARWIAQGARIDQ